MCQMTSRDEGCLGVGAFSRTAASSVAGRLLCGQGAIALRVAYPFLNCGDGPAARATAQMYRGRKAARIDSAIKCRAAERRDPQNVARSQERGRKRWCQIRRLCTAGSIAVRQRVRDLRLAHDLHLPYSKWRLRFRQCRACSQLQCVQDEVMSRIDLRALGAEHELAPDAGPILPARAESPIVLLGNPVDIL